MSKCELKVNKEEKQINDSIISSNQFKLNQEDLKKIKITSITDFNKNFKDTKNKQSPKDNQSNKIVKGEEQKGQQLEAISLNQGKAFKAYIDQGNKNSILFKFRSEINKSQQIVDREVEKTINLKLKYTRKRIIKTELEMRSTFLNNNNNSNEIKNLNFPISLQNGTNRTIKKVSGGNNLNLSNNFGKFNFQNAFNNNEANGSVSSKFKTSTDFLKSESNLNNKNKTTNNFFNTQIKIVNNNYNNNNTIDDSESQNFNNKPNNKESNDNNININNNPNLSPNKNQIDTLSRANSQNVNNNHVDFSTKTSAINQMNHFQSIANKTAGILGFGIKNSKNFNNSTANNNAENIGSDKFNFNAANDYFFQSSKINSNRIKSYNINVISNWFEKNQIPNQKYSPHMVNNIEFQSNAIIDQMRVLLDSIDHFKIHFLQGKNLVTIFKNLDPKRQVKYNKSLEESCGLLMEISIIILMDFTQYLEKFASIQPPTKERLNKSEVKNEETNFFYNIKLFSEITVYLKGCFEVYLILIKQLDDMLLPFKTYIKLFQYLARSRLGVSNLIFTAKNAFKNYCNDQSSVNKYIQVLLDINNQEETEINEGANEIANAAAPRSKRSNNYPRIPKTANFKSRMNNDDLSEKIRKQFMFKLNEDNQKMIRLNNVLNRKEYARDDSFEKKKKDISKKMLQGSCLNSNLVTKLLKYCPKKVKNQIISQRIIEMYKEKETQKN